MLESDESIWQDNYDMGYCEGIVIGNLRVVHILEKEYNIEKLSEKNMDLINFKKKYPNLNRDLLAKTVWRESEWWHGSYSS
jgi:hypothetical protein